MLSRGELLDDLHAAVEVGVERRAPGRRWRSAGRAARSRSCCAAGARSRESRRRRSRRPAPPTCRRSTRTPRPGCGAPRRSSASPRETSTVMPRSLNDPVWVLPHCLTQRSSRPISLAVALGPEEVRAALVHARRCSRLAGYGITHSFLPQTPDPYGQVLRRMRSSKRPIHAAADRSLRASTSCTTSSSSPHFGQ